MTVQLRYYVEHHDPSNRGVLLPTEYNRVIKGWHRTEGAETIVGEIFLVCLSLYRISMLLPFYYSSIRDIVSIPSVHFFTFIVCMSANNVDDGSGFSGTSTRKACLPNFDVVHFLINRITRYFFVEIAC